MTSSLRPRTGRGPLALLFNALVILLHAGAAAGRLRGGLHPRQHPDPAAPGLSLRWFRAVFEHPDFVASFWNSLWLALGSATLSTLLAVPAAWRSRATVPRPRGAQRPVPVAADHSAPGAGRGLLRLSAWSARPAASAGWCWRMRWW
jgi:ABC-type Fe3+ transport system permease subunit